MIERAPDFLVLEGQQRILVSFPLNAYLRELPAPPMFRIDDGVNQRGYVATWEVRPDHTLWLTRLQTRAAHDGPDPGIQLVFPGVTGPVAATWVCQELQSPVGRRFDLRGYASTVARMTSLTVWHGRVVLLEETEGARKQRLWARCTPHLEAEFGAEEGAFLRSAHAVPDDSAPRLVYADWLDERGDPRGDVVRLAERLRDADPATARREMAVNASILIRGLRHQLWTHVMGYDDLAAAISSFG
jgi:uncharacterized protein (TIGR02996 family)